MTEKMVKSNGVDICTEEFGESGAPTLLLIHGATVSMLRWPDGFCQTLAAGGRHVIRYDNRDTGRSTTYPPGSCEYTVEDLADDAVGVLDAYGIGRAHIVGQSMGGMATQQVALRHPERVLTITPISTTSDPSVLLATMMGVVVPAGLPGPTDRFLAAIGRRAELDPSDQAAAVDQLVAFFGALAGSRYPIDEAWERDTAQAELKRTDSFASAMNHAAVVAATPPWHERLSEVRAPTLVMHGTDDPILPYPHGEALAAAIPGAQLMALDGVGHDIPRGIWNTMTVAILEHTGS
jgi:pimeloyl-ACP methyl ester carboxylesterase